MPSGRTSQTDREIRWKLDPGAAIISFVITVMVMVRRVRRPQPVCAWSPSSFDARLGPFVPHGTGNRAFQRS